VSVRSGSQYAPTTSTAEGFLTGLYSPRPRGGAMKSPTSNDARGFAMSGTRFGEIGNASESGEWSATGTETSKKASYDAEGTGTVSLNQHAQ
jgi:hypothetical protein